MSQTAVGCTEIQIQCGLDPGPSVFPDFGNPIHPATPHLSPLLLLLMMTLCIIMITFPVQHLNPTNPHPNNPNPDLWFGELTYSYIRTSTKNTK